jgi:type II secretory pathway predicted ATPase ExeA
MYESWFHLTGRPFPSAPRVDCYFATEDSEQVRKSAKQCVEFGTGPGIIIGALGTGKSLMTLILKNDFLANRPVAIVRGSCLRSPHDLIQCLLHEFQRPIRHGNESEDRQALITFLSNGVTGRSPVVILDEAERVSSEVLSEVQGISQISNDGQWGLHLLLVGTESLEESLLLPGLRSLHQRIASRSRLYPFTRGVTQAFIKHQMRRVAADETALDVFSQEATSLVHELSAGVPRIVQQLCEHALILAAVAGKPTLDELAIHEAWNDLQQFPTATPASAKNKRQPELPTSAQADEFIEFGSLEQQGPTPGPSFLPDAQQWFENAPDCIPNSPVELTVSKDLDRIEYDIQMAFSGELSPRTHDRGLPHPGLPRELESIHRDFSDPAMSVAPHVRIRVEAERFAEASQSPIEKNPAPQEAKDHEESESPLRRGSSVRIANPAPRRPEVNPFMETFDEEILVVTPDAPAERGVWRAMTAVSTREGAALLALAIPSGPRGVFRGEAVGTTAAELEEPSEAPLEDATFAVVHTVSNPCLVEEAVFPEAQPEPEWTAAKPKVNARPQRYRRLFTRLMRKT